MLRKFISKQSNCRVVLRAGIPAERLTGRLATPGLYIYFRQGMAEIDDQSEAFQLMLNHLDFDKDYHLLEEGKEDPYKINRESPEPEHIIQEINHGSVGKNVGRPPSQFNKEQQKLVKKMMDDILEESRKEDKKEIKKLREELNMLKTAHGNLEKTVEETNKEYIPEEKKE